MTTVNMGLKQVQSNNNLSNSLVKIAMNYINEGIIITDKDNLIIYVNEKFEKMTGFTFKEIKNKTPKIFQSGVQGLEFYQKLKEDLIKKGKWEGELWNRSKKGDIYLQALKIIAIKNEQNEIENYIGISKDILQNRSINMRYLENVTYHDELTTLPKRSLFEKRVISAVKIAKQTNGKFGIVFFQLNNFTAINEKYGFLYGDILIKRVATRLYKQLPINSMVTRWDGTVFTCLLENIQTKDDLTKFVENLQKEISTPLIINDKKINLEANFGASIYSNDGITVSELLSKASTAMNVAKMEEKTLLFYETTMGKPNNLLIMELELKRAIEEEQFELYYQPLISVESNELIGFEALLRWIHPTDGIIPPTIFIPLAEQTGLIEKIGQIVFKKACLKLSEWGKLGFPNLNMSVNISMNQFKDKNLIKDIRNTMKETKVDPSDIWIELTESSLIDDMEITTLKLHELKNLGLSIAIDDFGTGYSSLGYLVDFPIQRIKIDRSFIKVMGKNKKVEAIVSAINTMAKTLNMEVVAEGIETEEQLNLIKQLDCNVAQGYFFDKPLSAEEVERKWLQTI